MLIILNVIINVLHVCARDNNTTESSAADAKSIQLVESIRRKLMIDNYDYVSTESDELLLTTRRKHDSLSNHDVPQTYSVYDARVTDNENNETRANEVNPKTGAGDNLNYDEEDFNISDDRQQTAINSLYVPRGRDEYEERNVSLANRNYLNDDTLEQANGNYSTNDAKDINDHGISKNDLYFYLDDEKLAEINRMDGSTTEAVATENEFIETVNTTAKYTFIKLKDPYRRSGSRRLVQEQRADGVAVLALDGGPLPLLRLPRARRHYERFDDSLQGYDDHDISLAGSEDSQRSYY